MNTKHMATGTLLAVIAIFSLVAADDALGQTFWTAGTGNWNTPSNWSLGIPSSVSPTTFDAVIANGGSAAITAPNASVRRLRVGRPEGSGILTLNNGGLTVTENLHLNEGGTGTATMAVQLASTVAAPSIIVGYSGPGSSMVIRHAGSMVTTNEINVGWHGNSVGALHILDVGLLSDIDGFLARFNGSTGTATVRGVGSIWNNTGILRVGHLGNGTLTVEDGGNVYSEYGYVGVADISTSTATIRGTDSMWTTGTDLFVGYEGTGTININAGGSVTNRDGFLGRLAGSRGTVKIDGDGSQWTSNRGLYIGDAGDGSLLITGGADVTAKSATMGRAAGSSGIVIVDGPGSTWTNAGQLYVGHAGAGWLTVSNGGQITNTSFGSINLGATAGSLGGITVEGAGSSVYTNNALSLGGDAISPTGGSASLLIRDGASVVSNTGYVGYAPDSVAEAHVEGPGSTWTTEQLLHIGVNGGGSLNISAGAKVHTNNGDAYVGGSSFTSGAGFAVVDGPGSAWTLSSTSPSGLYVGVGGHGRLSVLDGGTVSVASTNGIQIGTQGMVMGDGILDAAVYNGGVVTPGPSIGTLSIVNGPYRHGATGTLEIQLASASSYDKLHFPGAFIDGGTLDVTTTGGYLPAAGTSFDLMDWGPFGGISGSFATLSLPELPKSLKWDTSQLYAAGVLRVVSDPVIPGDFSEDGVVDASDYIVWRKSNGTVDQYEIWRSHFGQTAGAGSGGIGFTNSSASVPEPGTLALVVVGLAGLISFGKRRVRRTSGMFSATATNCGEIP